MNADARKLIARVNDQTNAIEMNSWVLKWKARQIIDSRSALSFFSWQNIVEAGSINEF